ncbi:MAG: amidohydrolase family protein, partial [Clostridia bacterium]|nr:amidohydrolase family protein [Clostridia bacterium]
RPHPRSYGAIAEFLRIAREERLCSLEEVVWRVSGKSAGVFSIPDRGRLEAGFAADITVFDPAVISSPATYLQPVRLARGVQFVFVNGEAAIWNGEQTDARAGRFLRRPVPKEARA